MAAVATAPSEMSTPQRFFKYFQNEIIVIQDAISRLGDKALVGGERKDAADHCLAAITRLASEVKDASSSLPSHDVKTYSEAIKALHEKLAETQAVFAPKPKFAFKTKKNASAISLGDAAELASQRRSNMNGTGSQSQSNESSFAKTPVHLVTPPSGSTTTTENIREPTQSARHDDHSKSTTVQVDVTAKPIDAPPLDHAGSSTHISSKTTSHIIVPACTSHTQAPCHLRNLQRCCVDLSVSNIESAPFATLTINDVKSSLLVCGNIAGPAHITGVKNSIILISCRQFRMHDCENVTTYLHCTSRPIIEDCKQVRFTKMPDLYYDFLAQNDNGNDLKTAEANHWDQIDDFKWLRAEQSPNWSFLPAEDQVSESVWQSIIPGKPGQNVLEILEAVKIAT